MAFPNELRSAPAGRKRQSPLAVVRWLKHAPSHPAIPTGAARSPGHAPEFTESLQALVSFLRNSSAHPRTTTICLETASCSSSLIIRKRLPSAVTS